MKKAVKTIIKAVATVGVIIATMAGVSACTSNYTLNATVVHSEYSAEEKCSIIDVVDSRGEHFSFDTKEHNKYHMGDSVSVTYNDNNTVDYVEDDIIVSVERTNCIHHEMGKATRTHNGTTAKITCVLS